ncbi:Pantoate-beta-alanine ligase [Novipirellula aureliae]|uniref:Pantothenate synthetase n=1 Tax=Novipirellula aureliae TaxID=2527966 RepID=A0A5C6E4C2_9BACT|nr:pantoate--beta-alanine ligase [Novipirellula aureliae]TWU43334.1 Pantoate-beta-alanine ligase [Novipirellula aureliae]
MRQLTTPEQAREFVLDRRFRGHTVGVVPTMGALHDGHLELVRQAKQHCDVSIATIFVNPTQFGPGEDLDKYPRLLEQDLSLLERIGADAVFLPSSESIYPPGFSTFVEAPDVGSPLEGVCRPSHFRGVTTIVCKLFQILPATHAFFGRKDYQQLKVIEAMVRDLNIAIEIVACDTVREEDGLALSSRNRYLDSAQRIQALALSRALQRAQAMATAGTRQTEQLEQAMRQELDGHADHPGVDRVEYAVVVDAETLLPLTDLNRPAVALIAAFVGQTRLIDNRLISALI